MIDLKTLHIGSHVLYEGKKYEVCAIVGSLVGIVVGHDPKKGTKVGEVPDELLEPIPITEELLKELGFEEATPPAEGWRYGIEKVLTKEFDSPIEEDYFISLAQYEGGLYQLQVLGTIAYVRNLHELENYVYLTTKKELL